MAKHEFTTPGIYVTDSWNVAMHYATPTRRIAKMFRSS